MTNKKLQAEITKKIEEANDLFLIELLKKCLGKEPEWTDLFRIKIIPIKDKKLAWMVSFDNVVIGIMEGTLQNKEEELKYIIDYIPAEDYRK